jgi:outer membrane receptor protein involved in Fe transport
VNSWTAGATLALDYHISDQFTATAALRADTTNYDYDNHLVDGNTSDEGIPCGVAGCLYARPADRSDRFENLSPGFTFSWRPNPGHMVYLNASTGFRPPETTELYRLQRQQFAADLDSENLDSVELGWKFKSGAFSANTALYAMKKNNVILRETNGFNVGNGATRHRGLEYELRRDGTYTMLSLNGTFARHEYAFSRAIEGGETIIDGNDIDTAPRELHSLSLEVDMAPLLDLEGLRVAIDANYVGKYYLDAANRASYPGHTVASLRLLWQSSGSFDFGLRIDNLFDKRYADRADFAFGNYRYFPARGRAVFLSVDYARN